MKSNGVLAGVIHELDSHRVKSASEAVEPATGCRFSNASMIPQTSSSGLTRALIVDANAGLYQRLMPHGTSFGFALDYVSSIRAATERMSSSPVEMVLLVIHAGNPSSSVRRFRA